MDNLSIEKDFVCEILVPGVVAAAALSKEERRRKMRKKIFGGFTGGFVSAWLQQHGLCDGNL